MVRMQKFVSEGIEAAGYEARSRTLAVQFKGGQIYEYKNVPSTVFNDFLNSSSKGGFVNTIVKPHFKYERITGPRPFARQRGGKRNGR